MKPVLSDDARSQFREIVDDILQNGEHYEVRRYHTPVAMIVPVGWYEQAAKVLAQVDLMLEDKAGGQEWQSGMTALREARRHETPEGGQS